MSQKFNYDFKYFEMLKKKLINYLIFLVLHEKINEKLSIKSKGQMSGAEIGHVNCSFR